MPGRIRDRRAPLRPSRVAAAVLIGGALQALAAGGAVRGAPESSAGPLVQVLVSASEADRKEALRGFRDGLAEQMGPEGKRYSLDIQYLDEDEQGGMEVSVRDEAHLIFSLGTPATRRARELAGERPVVFTMVEDPVGEGVYEPGGGPPSIGLMTELSLGDQLEALTQVLPKARRIGVLHHTADTARLEVIREGAAVRGLELVSIPVEGVDYMFAALEDLDVQIEVLWTFGRLLRSSSSPAQYLILYSLRNQLPFMGLSPSQVERGALFCAYASPEDIGRQAAGLVKDLLSGRGIPGSALKDPRIPRIALNLRAADAIGQAIPRQVRRSAEPIY